MGQQLAHLPDGHLVGHPAQHLQGGEVAQPHQLDHGPGVEVVAHDDRDLVAEQGVDGWHAPAQHRVIDRIVVHQRGEVDQLDHGSQAHGERAAIGGSGGLVHQQQHGRAEHLPSHLQQVGVDLCDQAEVRVDQLTDPLAHRREAGAQTALQVVQRRPGDAGDHPLRSWPSRCTRSPRSRKRMSTASARS